MLKKVPKAIKDRLYHYENSLIMSNTNNVTDNAIVPVTISSGYLTPREGYPDIPELTKGERWYYGIYLLKDI